MLAGYAEVNPAYPDMIMGMARDDAQSLVRARDATVTSEARAVTAAAVGTVAIPVLGLVLGFIAVMAGHDVAAIFATTPAVLVGLAKVIAAARRRNEDS